MSHKNTDQFIKLTSNHMNIFSHILWLFANRSSKNKKTRFIIKLQIQNPLDRHFSERTGTNIITVFKWRNKLFLF